MIDRRIQETVVWILAIIAAIELGGYVVTLGEQGVGIIIAAVLAILWTFNAGAYWWVPLMVGVTIGGILKFGFKVYPVEVGLALAIIAVVPAILTSPHKIFQMHRKPLPAIFYITGVYCLGRVVFDIWGAHAGLGNLMRVLSNVGWPFVISWLFYHYGKTTVAGTAIKTMVAFLVLRVMVSLLAAFTTQTLYIPGINYYISSGSDSYVELRLIGLTLLMGCFIMFQSSRSELFRWLAAPIFAVCGYLVLLGGGRFSAAVLMIMPVSFFIWTRRWSLIAVSFFVSAGILLAINAVPDQVAMLPTNAQRSLSPMVYTESSKQQEEWGAMTGGSDRWHQRLKDEAYRRWTLTPLTIAFGYGIRPTQIYYDANISGITGQMIVEAAADDGQFECGLATVLDVLGVTGLVLYLLLFVRLWKEAWPAMKRPPGKTMREGMMFWGYFGSVMWILTCNTAGFFPNMEIFLLVFGLAVVEDEKYERATAVEPSLPRAYPKQWQEGETKLGSYV
jgi:hypothetical protein